MKLCNKCGAGQADTHFFCAQCGEKLGQKLPEQEQTERQEALKNTLTAQALKMDSLYISPADKAAGVLSLAGFAAGLYLLFFDTVEKTEVVRLLCTSFTLFCIVLYAFFPRISWGMPKRRPWRHSKTPKQAASASEYYHAGKACVIWCCLFSSLLNLLEIFLS